MTSNKQKLKEIVKKLAFIKQGDYSYTTAGELKRLTEKRYLEEYGC